MQALVVFESMFGNTAIIAEAVADGMSRRMPVESRDVATLPDPTGSRILVVGAPTHAFGLSRPATRRSAVQQGAACTATDLGLREWLDLAPRLDGVLASSFDTRIDKPRMPGSAAHRAQRALRRLGCHLVVPAESFRVIGSSGPLAPGEVIRARDWGERLAATIMAMQQVT
jgi:hypothetical protein